MDKNNRSFPWGDFPGLNAGPKSTEHQTRHLKRDVGGLTSQNSVAAEKSGVIKRNHAK
jgi:hypothetical protein